MSNNDLQLFKCLADTSRLSILASLQNGPQYCELIAERLALTPSTASFHLKKLEAAGLVTSQKEQYYTVYSINTTLLTQPLVSFLGKDQSVENQQKQREDAYRQKVLDTFWMDGKVKALPAQQKKRLIVLEEILARFVPGKQYPEREVNLTISEVYDDYCTIRREFIVFGYMKRENGVYWRLSEIDPPAAP